MIFELIGKSQAFKNAYHTEKDRLDAIAGRNLARSIYGVKQLNLE